MNVRRPGGFVLPHPPRDTRTFETKSGGPIRRLPDRGAAGARGHLVLQTLRSHDQFNTTIYGLSDRYRGIEGGRKVIFLHPDDIAHLGFRDGDLVDIVTHWEADDRVTLRPKGSGSSPTTPRAVRPPPTTRRPTRWSRWIPPRWRATARPRSRSSSGRREAAGSPPAGT